MYYSHHRYLAVAFVDAESVSPSVNDIAALMGAFAPVEVIPNSLVEQTPVGSKNRVGFISQDNVWQIGLLGSGFQVAKMASDPLKDHLGDFSAFCSEASRLLKIALEHFRRKAHRLAAVREGLLREMPDTEMSRITTNLMNLPDTYKHHIPNEWDWRAVIQIERQIEDLKESVNTITVIKRTNGVVLSQQGQLGLPRRFSRIRVDFDINTLADNTSARFGDNHIDSFYAQTQEWHGELEAEVAKFIGEE